VSSRLEVVGLALFSSGLVCLLGVLVFRRLVARSLPLAAVLVAVVPTLAFAVGLVVTAKAMFLSGHDLRVALLVCVTAGVVSVVVALALSSRVGTLQRDLAHQQEQLERERQVEASRRELVAGVSHDLRTPLAGLRAMAEALEDGVVDDPEHYHRQMRAQIERLSRMVDDLFELSRLQSGTLSLCLDVVSAGDVVSDALAAADPYAREHGVRLRGHADTGADVLADEAELHRALGNLVVNAIRHTPADGVVDVSVGRRDGQVVFSVADECGGIAEEELTRVFDVSWRGDQARTPGRDGGAGLGLAIVRGIAEAHRGAVAVSNRGSGCRFELALPAGSPEAG